MKKHVRLRQEHVLYSTNNMATHDHPILQYYRKVLVYMWSFTDEEKYQL